MFEAQKAASQRWNLCFKKEGLKDETDMYLYSFFMVMYKKKIDLCFEMNLAFIVKLIMLHNFHLFFIIKMFFFSCAITYFARQQSPSLSFFEPDSKLIFEKEMMHLI